MKRKEECNNKERSVHSKREKDPGVNKSLTDNYFPFEKVSSSKNSVKRMLKPITKYHTNLCEREDRKIGYKKCERDTKA